jgi:hypothetical protein
MDIEDSAGHGTACNMRFVAMVRGPRVAREWGRVVLTLGSTGGMPFQALYSMALAPLPSTDKSNDSTSGNKSEANSAAGR